VIPTRLSTEEQARFAWQLAHLLYRTTRLFGLIAAVVAFVCLIIPGAVELRAIVPITFLLAATVIAHVTLTYRPQPLWMAAAYSLALCTIYAIAVLPGAGVNVATATAIATIAGGLIGSMATVMVSSWGQAIVLVAGFVTTVCFVGALFLSAERGMIGTVVFIALCWAISATFGVWLCRSLPRVMRRVGAIGRAYNIERRASETEAMRHRDARLLHDTALATLTLLAHSGVGVSHDALREQAHSDGMLLKRLRLGQNPAPRASGAYTLTNTAELALGGTLDSLRSRFSGMGLEIDWHGSGQLGLPGQKLEAFILALTECLENVRRHSGVTAAHVTLSDDGTVVRGVVTDAGVGFDPENIPGGHLGFAESVVARVQDVGGSVRTFSAPDAGTTVVLEVPK